MHIPVNFKFSFIGGERERESAPAVMHFQLRTETRLTKDFTYA